MDPAFPKSSTDVLAKKQKRLFSAEFPAVLSYQSSTRCVLLARAVSCAILSPVRQKYFGGGGMDSAFAPWIGLPVILQVALGDIKVPLRGKLLKDSGETLRMRIGEGWDVDIYKAMVVAVEEDAMATIPA